MTRELKLALILGLTLMLVVGVLISDHLSGARDAQIASVDPPLTGREVVQAPTLTAAPTALHGASPSTALVDPGEQAGAPLDSTLVAMDDTGDERSSPIFDLAEARRWFEEHAAGTGASMPLAAGVDRTQTTPGETEPLVIEMGAGAPGRQDAGLVRAPRESSQGTYRVEEGDTLWSLAQRFLGDGRRHPEIVAMNQGRLGPNNELRAGTTIVLPGGSPAQAARSAPVAEPKKPAPTATTYTVKSGDSLRKIAERLLGSPNRWNEIYEANRQVLKDKDVVRVGMELRIPAR